VEFLSENETAPKRGNKEIQERRLTKETTTKKTLPITTAAAALVGDINNSK
jgi:hypothetical protein